MLRKNKKGDLSSLFFFMIMVFFIAVAGLITYYVGHTISEKVQDTVVEADIISQPDIEAEFNSTIESVDTKILSLLDYVFMAIFIGLIISMIILSFLVSSNPVFFPLFIIIWIFAVVAAVPLANSWTDISTQDVFNTTITHLTITDYVVSDLPWYIGVTGMIIAIFLFSKTKGEGGTQIGTP